MNDHSDLPPELPPKKYHPVEITLLLLWAAVRVVLFFAVYSVTFFVFELPLALILAWLGKPDPQWAKQVRNILYFGFGPHFNCIVDK